MTYKHTCFQTHKLYYTAQSEICPSFLSSAFWGKSYPIQTALSLPETGPATHTHNQHYPCHNRPVQLKIHNSSRAKALRYSPKQSSLYCRNDKSTAHYTNTAEIKPVLVTRETVSVRENTEQR